MREENKAMLTVLFVMVLAWFLAPLAAVYETYLNARDYIGDLIA